MVEHAFIVHEVLCSIPTDYLDSYTFRQAARKKEMMVLGVVYSRKLLVTVHFRLSLEVSMRIF